MNNKKRIEEKLKLLKESHKNKNYKKIIELSEELNELWKEDITK